MTTQKDCRHTLPPLNVTTANPSSLDSSELADISDSSAHSPSNLFLDTWAFRGPSPDEHPMPRGKPAPSASLMAAEISKVFSPAKEDKRNSGVGDLADRLSKVVTGPSIPAAGAEQAGPLTTFRSVAEENAVYLARGSAADIWKISQVRSRYEATVFWYEPDPGSIVSKMIRISPQDFVGITDETDNDQGCDETITWEGFVEAYKAKITGWRQLNHANIIRVHELSQDLNLRVDYCLGGCVRDVGQIQYPTKDVSR
ncbi:unnamed protein product [Rhizoctonia solani]|uniref:Protein kinase domain-containing protein n=1 Tax=Rhizoctonia solani TaxID=456999 RepID=A0A8H3C4T7_9AGAM|nr:unnamed protein product [Rhizoctonia solani]